MSAFTSARPQVMADTAPDSTSPIPVNPLAGMSWDNTLGALLIGVLASGMLFGLTCMQVYTYFERASLNDGKKLKALVALLWCVRITLRHLHRRLP